MRSQSCSFVSTARFEHALAAIVPDRAPMWLRIPPYLQPYWLFLSPFFFLAWHSAETCATLCSKWAKQPEVKPRCALFACAYSSQSFPSWFSHTGASLFTATTPTLSDSSFFSGWIPTWIAHWACQGIVVPKILLHRCYSIFSSDTAFLFSIRHLKPARIRLTLGALRYLPYPTQWITIPHHPGS